MNTNIPQYINNQRRLLNYLSGARHIFRRGSLRFRCDRKQVRLSYSQASFGGTVSVETTIPYTTTTNTQTRDMIRQIQDFVINCYYEFERDGSKLKLKELATLMGMNTSSTHEALQRILKAMGNFLGHNDDDGHAILSQDAETQALLQDRRQTI